MKTFRPYQPQQCLLLPPSLDDWLPEDHLARFVSDLVDQLDLSCIYAAYERRAMKSQARKWTLTSDIGS